MSDRTDHRRVLACPTVIGRCVPPNLTAPALMLYGPLGLGLSSALFTLAALLVVIGLVRGDRSRSGERVRT